jgi:hypothetical protein
MRPAGERHGDWRQRRRVCRQVERWAATGINQMIFMFQIGRTTHSQIMRSIEIVGRR